MTNLYETPRVKKEDGEYVVDDIKFNYIREKIVQGHSFELLYMNNHSIRRQSRGCNIAIYNPAYNTKYTYRHENTLNTKSNHPKDENYILFVDEEEKKLMWTMDINTLNIYHEATHSMLSSKFYVDRFGVDFDIQIIL